MTKDWRRGAWLALIVTSTYVALLTLPAPTVAWLTDEDTLGTESAGALGFFLAGIFMLIAFKRVRRERHGGKAFAIKQLFLLGMGLLFIFAAGEEISWGQRIFGISTPDALLEANRQQETNLHNLNATYPLVPFTHYRFFTFFWLTYTLVIPVAALVSAPAKRFFGSFVPLVPIAFGLAQVLNDALSIVAGKLIASDVLTFGALVDDNRIELREGNLGVLCALTAYYVARTAATAAGTGETARVSSPKPGVSGSRDSRESVAADAPVMARRV